jgi:hypothetical protein
MGMVQHYFRTKDEMLPSTRESRQEAAVSIAFFNRAVVTPAYAEAIRAGYERILALLTGQLPAGRAGCAQATWKDRFDSPMKKPSIVVSAGASGWVAAPSVTNNGM